MISAPSQQPQLVIQRRPVDIQYYPEQLERETAIEMMLVPSGTFMMGSPEDELERLEIEGPQHEVTIPSFFMSKHPITQEQWRAVAKLPQINRKLDLDPSHFKGDHNPVEQVSWFEALEYCDRLAKHTNRSYRLPSEAEWEYACRAETTTPFHFGEIISTDHANYCGVDRTIEGTEYKGSYGDGPLGEYRKQTTPINTFPNTNAFGLCEMHGNVWEWCQDHWHDKYNNSPNDGSAWLDSTTDEDKSRILRGGSWDGDPRYCRSACRYGFNPVDRFDVIGFRVVVSAPSSLQ